MRVNATNFMNDINKNSVPCEECDCLNFEIDKNVHIHLGCIKFDKCVCGHIRSSHKRIRKVV